MLVPPQLGLEVDRLFLGDRVSLPLVDLTGAVSHGSLGQRGAAAVMSVGLQPDQPSGRKREVPVAACVPFV